VSQGAAHRSPAGARVKNHLLAMNFFSPVAHLFRLYRPPPVTARNPAKRGFSGFISDIFSVCFSSFQLFSVIFSYFQILTITEKYFFNGSTFL
jgi:hypothetical protein